MSEKHISTEESKNIIRKAKNETHEKEHAQPPGSEKAALVTLQQKVGNRAVQRLLAQRSGDGPFELDEDTANQINQQRGGGQALDSGVQASMGSATGHDFSGVKVHNNPESHTLNEQLGAKAFTTGHDIFFRSGAYNPGSSGGQELLAHELTHVVQQDTGQVSGGSKMTVNAPGDAFEQEADSVAKSFSSPGAEGNIQRQPEEEEEQVQTQPEEEEEQVQTQPEEEEQEVQAQPEEEEQEVQAQPEEEEEEVQAQPEEEEAQMQEEDEEVQMQDMPEEEEVQAKR